MPLGRVPPVEPAGQRRKQFPSPATGLDSAAFVERIRATHDHRRRDLASLSSRDLERPSWMPTGPGTYGRFPAIRAFDFWVHERDITTPLARVTDDTGVAANIALAEAESSLGDIVGKKAGCPTARQRVGRDRAVDLILRAKTVSGPEALRLGLVTEVWPNAELKQKAFVAQLYGMGVPNGALRPDDSRAQGRGCLADCRRSSRPWRAVLDTSGHSTVRSWGLLLPVLI